MITSLRYIKYINYYRCSNVVKLQLCSGFQNTIQCLPRKFANDSKVNKRALEARAKLKPLNKGSEIRPCPVHIPGKDKAFAQKTIGAAKCDSSKPPPPPCDEGMPKLYKFLIGIIGGAAILGAYYMTRPKKLAPPDQEGHYTSKVVPTSSADIPKYVPYLLIGGGTASFSAFRAIKSHDPKAKVLVITDELRKPYMRPPLSKELWYSAVPGEIPSDFRFKQWNGAERSLFYEPDEFYCDPAKLMSCPNGGVAVAQGYRVKRVDPSRQVAILYDDTEINYDECLIATGCSPKTLEVFETATIASMAKDKITTIRSPCDYEKLRRVADTKKSITVVGSGFLGSEIACALAAYGKPRGLKVNQVFYESGNMAKILPEYLSKWTTLRVEEQGVCVVPRTHIVEVATNHDSLKLVLNNGKAILTDHVVVCVGCEPNVQVANGSGLEIDKELGGIVVNSELEARRHLFAAGDVASFYDPLLGRRRVEHHDHSVVSGRLAGENMVGLKKPYNHQSMFWSDLGPNIGYEAIGICDSTLPTVAIFAKFDPDELQERKPKLEKLSLSSEDETQDKQENSTTPKLTQLVQTEENILKLTNVENKPSCEDDDAKSKDKSKACPDGEDDFGRGVVFYLQNEKIVGILLWNVFNRIGIARQVLRENRKYDDLNEVAKLFEIHS